MTSWELICVAKRIRWASPPESEADDRLSERYWMPTSHRKRRRNEISRRISVAMVFCDSVRCLGSSLIHSLNSEMSMAANSAIFLPASRKCRDSFFSREPWQCGHGAILMNWLIHFRNDVGMLSVFRLWI